MSDLERIVRDLADIEPLIDKGDHITGPLLQCGCCDAYTWGKHVPPGADPEPGEPVRHLDVCPWRRAVEWVEANPT